jgi:hypothetical protein
MVPVVHMLAENDEFGGGVGLFVEFLEKGVGRRTARATLRREKFNYDGNGRTWARGCARTMLAEHINGCQ